MLNRRALVVFVIAAILLVLGFRSMTHHKHRYAPEPTSQSAQCNNPCV
jgi:hypothetical protein